MKLFTSILLMAGWLALGLNSNCHSGHASGPDTHTRCMATCCEDGACCCSDEQGEQPGQDRKDHSCPAGCDCTCHSHTMAVGFHFTSGYLPHFSHMEYMVYTDSYAFEYAPPLFHPPRLG